MGFKFSCNHSKKDKYTFGNKSCIAMTVLFFFIGPFAACVCCFPIDEKSEDLSCGHDGHEHESVKV